MECGNPTPIRFKRPSFGSVVVLPNGDHYVVGQCPPTQQILTKVKSGEVVIHPSNILFIEFQGNLCVIGSEDFDLTTYQLRDYFVFLEDYLIA